MVLQVQYAAEPIDLDEPLQEVAAMRPGKPLRIRVQPTLLRRAGDHVGWRGVSWTVACPTIGDAVAFRRALEAFFAALSVHGAIGVARALTPDEPTQ